VCHNWPSTNERHTVKTTPLTPNQVRHEFAQRKAVLRGEALSDIEQLMSCMRDCYEKREILAILARTDEALATMRTEYRARLAAAGE